MKNITKTVPIIAITILFFSCSDKLKKIPEDNFVGLWEIQGRSMFDGIQIKIEKENNDLIGRITKLNGNKLVKMFADSNDVWVAGIDRTSNFEFKLTEKKIAKDLFSLYGISTSQDFKVQFINDNTIGLGTESSNPQTSKVIYKRIIK
jgi:hypothetical protein